MNIEKDTQPLVGFTTADNNLTRNVQHELLLLKKTIKKQSLKYTGESRLSVTKPFTDNLLIGKRNLQTISLNDVTEQSNVQYFKQVNNFASLARFIEQIETVFANVFPPRIYQRSGTKVLFKKCINQVIPSL